MRKTEGLVKQNMDSVMNPLDISEPVVVPETPEPKRPPGPVSERMVSIVLDTDSDSDLEISGTSLVLPGKQAGILKEEQVRDAVIVLSDEEEEERMTMTRQKNGGGTLEDTPNQTTELPGRMLLGADDPARKRKRHVGDSSPRSEAINSSKKQAPQQEPVTDDSEDEGWNPSWKSQEDMVKRLQLTFPCLIKEELREALMQHDWRFEDTLGALRLFSEEVKGSSQQSTPSSPAAAPASQTPAAPASQTPAAPASQTPAAPASQTPAGRPASPPSPPRQTANGTAGATARAAGRRNRRPPRRALGSSSSEDEAGDSEGLSEWGDSDEGGAPPRVAATTTAATNDQILRFFQEASLDELSLIHGCSLKKAQRIIELRPYEKWEDLMVVFQSGSGLSSELLQGCRVVLREQQVVRSLMKKCESISGTMRKDVTQVLKGTWSYSTQPQILNRQYEMKPYQLIGLNWLSLLHRNKLSGILADEMGLGKTIQAIAFLASLYQEGNTGPHLITVPASTLDNWVRELNLWCPSLNVLVYYGSIEERRLIKRDILDEVVDYNVIISTYAVTIGNSSDRSLFRKLRLEYAVFDEGHMLKNMSSLRYRHLMDINAKHRLLLTGTPLQNNLLELMSLLNFIMPDMFSNSTSQIVKMFSMKSSEEQSAFEMERIAHAKLIIKPFILRRVKSEVLQQLPAKEQKVENCAMTEKQQRLYDALFLKLKESTGGEKREMTNVMMQLRKMANHPLMHRQYYSPTTLAAMSQLMLKEPTHRDANPALVLEDMMVMTDYGLHRLCLQYPSILDYQLSTDLLLDSGKLSFLTQLLASLKSNGDRVVLFSQFTMMLDILEVFLKHHNHRFIRLDGSTPMSDRIVLIDQFNTDTDIFVFLLSTKAGGLGINLTSANVVILHDIDCNPYNDKQAEDRCHRVGQSRTVRVFKLISKGSIEDAMLRIGQKKLKLEQDITTIQEGNEGLISEDMASVLKASLGL